MSWDDFQRFILRGNKQHFVQAVLDLLKAGGNKASISKTPPVDIIVNRPGGQVWAVCCFRNAPHDRLTTQVLDELFLVHKNYHYDRVIAFTMSEFVSTAAETLDPTGPIRVMKRDDIHALFSKLTERSHKQKMAQPEEISD